MNNLFCIEQKIGDCWVFGIYMTESELWEKESHSFTHSLTMAPFSQFSFYKFHQIPTQSKFQALVWFGYREVRVVAIKRKLKSYRIERLGKMAPWHNWQLSRNLLGPPFKSIAHSLPEIYNNGSNNRYPWKKETQL